MLEVPTGTAAKKETGGRSGGAGGSMKEGFLNCNASGMNWMGKGGSSR